MVKKTIIILSLVVAAQCAAIVGLPGLAGLAFAQLQEDGQPCPPECVTDSMEIVTLYPSPYNEYEELRLYPISDSNSQCNSDNRGLMYYDSEDDKVKLCKGPAGLNNWQDLGGAYWDVSGNDISNTNLGKVSIVTTDSNKVSLEASGAVRLGNYATSSLPICSNTILGALIYYTTQKRPYVCALNASNSPVWKPLDSDYDRDGITDAVDANDNDFNDATAMEANVETGKTFYARGGSRRTGALEVEAVQNFCAVGWCFDPSSCGGSQKWHGCSKFGSKAICIGSGNTTYNQCSCALGYTLKLWVDDSSYSQTNPIKYEVYYCEKS